jgi:hypothetical protein
MATGTFDTLKTCPRRPECDSRMGLRQERRNEDDVIAIVTPRTTHRVVGPPTIVMVITGHRPFNPVNIGDEFEERWRRDGFTNTARSGGVRPDDTAHRATVLSRQGFGRLPVTLC